MTHAINTSTNLLSIDITRTHTQMRKSPRGEKESGNNMRRDREFKKLEKRVKGENKKIYLKKKARKKEKSTNKLKINKRKMKK